MTMNLAEWQRLEGEARDRRQARLTEWATRTRTAALLAIANPFTPQAHAARLVRLYEIVTDTKADVGKSPASLAWHGLLAEELMF